MAYDQYMEQVATRLAYEDGIAVIQNVEYYSNASTIEVEGDWCEKIGLQFIHPYGKEKMDVLLNHIDKYDINELNYDALKETLEQWAEFLDRKANIRLQIKDDYIRMIAPQSIYLGEDDTAHKGITIALQMLQIYVHNLKPDFVYAEKHGVAKCSI